LIGNSQDNEFRQGTGLCYCWVVLIAIVKITSSDKGVMFVTDEGVVFMTSKGYLKKYLDGESKARFLLLTRMPFDIDVSKFKPSPLFDDGSVVSKGVVKDSWGKGFVKDKRMAKSYSKDVDVSQPSSVLDVDV